MSVGVNVQRHMADGLCGTPVRARTLMIDQKRVSNTIRRVYASKSVFDMQGGAQHHAWMMQERKTRDVRSTAVGRLR